MRVSDNTTNCDLGNHQRRGLRRRRKFQAAIIEGLQSLEGVEYLGKDRRVLAVLGNHGLPLSEINVHRVALMGKVLHVIGISNRLWYSRHEHAALKMALSGICARGHRVATIPQRAVEGLLGSRHTSPATFFDMVLHRALRRDLGEMRPCSPNRDHDPVGCFAVALSTGAACLG